ncbi:hypothetical protein M0P98_06960 [bacterium]|nr:hypothetical protein [bacterium]
MEKLWNKDFEENFFTKSLEFATPEQLFYITNNKQYVAYWPKNYKQKKSTLQSRNALIGAYTEKWTTDLFNYISDAVGGYSIQGVISEEIGLTRQSSADVAICKTKEIIQKPQNILLLIEVKMSIVWNWQFISENKNLICIGDYKTHSGNPSILRSDTMLKAIGKSINIRVSDFSASKIPIIVIGNTPITKTYHKKVDSLKRNGIIQGFWSINPKPIDENQDNVKATPHKGFYRFDNYEELKSQTLSLLQEEKEFFASMQTKNQLGRFIELANSETTYERKAIKFLELLKESI